MESKKYQKIVDKHQPKEPKTFNLLATFITGGIIGLLILFTRLYQLIIGLILIFIGMFVGNYVQHNKYDVKEKLKNYIDRL